MEIKSSLLNSDEFKLVKQSIEEISQVDNEGEFRVKLIEYINDTADNNDDEFFFDMLEFTRFLHPQKDADHIAYTDTYKQIWLNAPKHDISDLGSNVRKWDFIYCHECLHQLWDTFGVADKIKSEGLKYDHTLLNIASDCVINDYLKYYRKKVALDEGIYPETLRDNYDVEYNRKHDTQYTLYVKLLEKIDEIKDSEEYKNAEREFNGKLIPKSVKQQEQNSQGGGKSEKHSPDYIKGYGDAIQDVLDKKIDPINDTPKETGNNDYDAGYKHGLKDIKKGLEEGITMSSNSSGGQQSGSDLPQIPWDHDQQNNQNNQNSGKSGKNDAQRAQEAANKAQEAADKAKQADNDKKSDSKSSQQAANKAQEAADKAKQAANEAKQAIDKANEERKKADDAREAGDSKAAHDHEKNAENAEAEAKSAANRAENALEEAKSSASKAGADVSDMDSQSSYDDLKSRAENIKNNAENSAKDAENTAKNGTSEEKAAAKEARKHADEAKKAADNAIKELEKAKAAKSKGNEKEAKKHEDAAKEELNKAEHAADEAWKSSNGTKSDSEQNGSGSRPDELPDEKYNDSLEHSKKSSDYNLEELRQRANDIIEKHKNKVSGLLGSFIEKCNLSKKLISEAEILAKVNKGSTGWNNKMNTFINAYVKMNIFKKQRQYKKTYQRVRRGSGFVKMGQPIQPGKKILDDKLTISIAFYVDVSGSMQSCINDVWDAAYLLCESIKKQFGKNNVVDDVLFSMYGFDEAIHPIKYGKRLPAMGGNCSFDELAKHIVQKSGNYLINVIITDAGFEINPDKSKKFIEELAGCLIFITNIPSPEMKELSSKMSTKSHYILADANFKLG